MESSLESAFPTKFIRILRRDVGRKRTSENKNQIDHKRLIQIYALLSYAIYLSMRPRRF